MKKMKIFSSLVTLIASLLIFIDILQYHVDSRSINVNRTSELLKALSSNVDEQSKTLVKRSDTSGLNLGILNIFYLY
jgi:hypothetical protein